MQIFGFHMNRLLNEDEYDQMMSMVSEDRQTKVKKFIHPEDANRGLIGDVLIRSIIRSKFHVSNDQIAFAANTYGKPYALRIPSFHFNLSHSGRWIVCAVDCEPLGIDIEKISPIGFEIAERFFSMEELHSLMEKEDTEQLPYFYDLWTIKESFIKQLGKGLSIPLHSFSINLQEMKLENEVVTCFFKQYTVDPDYKMAVCSATGIFPERVVLKSYKDLLF